MNKYKRKGTNSEGGEDKIEERKKTKIILHVTPSSIFTF